MNLFWMYLYLERWKIKKMAIKDAWIPFQDNRWMTNLKVDLNIKISDRSLSIFLISDFIKEDFKSFILSHVSIEALTTELVTASWTKLLTADLEVQTKFLKTKITLYKVTAPFWINLCEKPRYKKVIKT